VKHTAVRYEYIHHFFFAMLAS